MNLEKIYIYDIETYKEAFTFSIVRADGKHKKTFEVSKFNNQLEGVFNCLDYLKDNECYMVGFNNLAFDYPIIHDLADHRRKNLKLSGEQVACMVHGLAQIQINSFKDGGFGNTIKNEEIPQIDLYKINHMDNKAKATGLKMLEFNMRLNNIEDLPFGIEESLTEEMIERLKYYNEHDVEATRQFFLICKPQVEFRFALTEKYGRSFINHNDGKIGKDYFQMKLEEEGVPLYKELGHGKRMKLQSKRCSISIKDCLFNYYDFQLPETKAIFSWFAKQRITETKGVFTELDEGVLGELSTFCETDIKRKKFPSEPTEQELARFTIEHPLGWVEIEELKATTTVKNTDGTKTKVHKKSHWGCWREASSLNIVLDGLRIDFGTGGIHASRSDVIAKETETYRIIDQDVSSQYPNLAIVNRVFPEHLSVKFCDIYQDVYEQRKSYAKGTPENAMLKLALNSVYGDSNNKFSVFYDPKYTMTITINGQLSVLLLAEKLLSIPKLRLIQLNTDGLTAAVPKDQVEQYKEVCKAWEKQVKLELEQSDYSKMYIKDCNNYIAVFTNGKVKRKGAYQYEGLGWHQNHSALVIQKAAEAAMLHGKDVEEFIRAHTDKFDFMLRTKVPRSSKLVLRYPDGFNEDGKEVFRDEPQQNICRYYPSVNGGKLIKLMPALPDKEDQSDRELSIDKEWNVKTCNNAMHFSFDDLDYSYYVNEANKLIIGR